MISLTCTNCKAVLQMDEGFAGGVCRCRHCGAIQTVPSSLRAKGGGSSSARKKVGRTLYSKARGDAIPSSGLDELAQVIASSGLGSGLMRERQAIPERRKPRNAMMLLGIGGGTLAVVLGVAIWLMAGRSVANSPPAITNPPRNVSRGVAQSQLPDKAPAPPGFCGVPITDNTVIYVLDRGSATADLFSYLKEATFRSVESLGPERRFQIVFWNNGRDDAFPSSSPTFATPSNVETARKALDDVYAHSQTDVASAITLAVASNPDLIILATGKAGQLSDEFAQKVLSIRGDKQIKIDAYDINGNDLSRAFQTISDRSGGTARLLSEADLKHGARD